MHVFVTVTASFLLGSTNAEKCPGKMVASGLPRTLMGEVLSVPKQEQKVKTISKSTRKLLTGGRDAFL